MKPTESFIDQPIRGLQTMLRVIALDDPTIPLIVPDGIYGQTTLRAVTAFQRRENLPLTGITDQRTWDAIVRSYQPAQARVGKAEPIEIIMDRNQVFSLGDEGPYIFLMQSMLIWLFSFEEETPALQHNGRFDKDTQNALIAFQELAGLEPTGELDKYTWMHLSRHFTLSAHHHSPRNVIRQENS